LEDLGTIGRKNIETCLEGILYVCIQWINLAQDKKQ
jgi:hypothetical protein